MNVLVLRECNEVFDAEWICLFVYGLKWCVCAHLSYYLTVFLMNCGVPQGPLLGQFYISLFCFGFYMILGRISLYSLKLNWRSQDPQT